MLAANTVRGHEPLVRVCGRHPDVDHGYVGTREADVAEQALGVLRLRDDVDAGMLEQPDDALAGEEQVVGDDYAHGIRIRSVRRPVSTLPPRAPTRSSSATIGSRRSAPSSSTRNTTVSPSANASTST